LSWREPENWVLPHTSGFGNPMPRLPRWGRGGGTQNTKQRPLLYRSRCPQNVGNLWRGIFFVVLAGCAEKQGAETMLGAWANAVSSLAKVVNPQAIKDWIEPLEAVSEDGGHFVIKVPSRWHLEMIQQNYLPFLLDRLKEQLQQECEVVFKVDEADHV